MKAMIRNIKDFGTLNIIGVHQIVESERDIDDAICQADRDNFPRVIFYFRYPANWMTDHDFRDLVSKARESVGGEITDDEVESYLMGWYESEGFSDFNLAMDRGLIIYALEILMSAGAIEAIDRESAQVIAWYEKNCTQKAVKKELKLLLRNVEVWTNPETNETHFVPYGDIDYFMRQSDLKEMGLEFEGRYDAKGRARKTSVMKG